MTTSRISMREASRVLGVSQLRVRELIRKGTLEAERVLENGAERWAIASASVDAYVTKRSEQPSGNGSVPGSSQTPAAPSPETGPADKLRALIADLERAQRQMAALRTSAIEVLAALKPEAPRSEAKPKAQPSQPKAEAPKAEKAEAPKAEAPKAEKTEAPKAEKAEAPKTEAPKAEQLPLGDEEQAPKAEAPKAEAPKAKKGPKPKKAETAPAKAAGSKSGTAMAAALRDVGLEAEDKPKPKAKAKSRPRKKS